jgi:hypothetical protein
MLIILQGVWVFSTYAVLYLKVFTQSHGSEICVGIEGRRVYILGNFAGCSEYFRGTTTYVIPNLVPSRDQ